MKKILSAVALAALAGCSKVTIESPKQNEVFAVEAPPFVLNYDSAPEGLKVELNGVDVTSQFQIGNKSATADLDALFLSGRNKLEVVNPTTMPVTFIWDDVGPRVHITEVGLPKVSGYLRDDSGVKSATLNGTPINIREDGSFDVNVSGSEFQFNTIDTNDFSTTTKFANLDKKFTPAMGVRIERPAINFLAQELAVQLDDEAKLSALLVAASPIKNEGGLSTLWHSFDIYLDRGSIGRATFGLNLPNSSTIDVRAYIPNLDVDARVRIKPPVLPAYWLSASPTVTWVDLKARGNIQAVSGSVKLNNFDVYTLELGTIDVNLSSWIDWLVNPFANLFNGVIEWVFRGQIENLVPEKIEQFIDAIPRDLLVNINGNVIKPEIAPTSITNPSDGISLVLGGRIVAQTKNGPTVLGSLTNNSSAMPPIKTVSPEGRKSSVGAVISSDVINQSLAAVTQAGFLNVEINKATLAALNPNNIQGANTGDDFRIVLTPASPPTVEFGVVNDGLGTLSFEDFEFRLDLKRDGSDWKTVFGTTLNIRATADLGANDQGFLKIGVVGIPDIEVIRTVEGQVLPLSPVFINTIINRFMPAVLPIVADLVGTVPLPSFEGYSVAITGFWFADTERKWVSLGMNLIRVQESAELALPSTTIGMFEDTRIKGLVREFDSSEEIVVYADSFNPDPATGYNSIRWNVNGGPWTNWRKTETIRLNLLPGDNILTVCSMTPEGAVEVECPSMTIRVK